jgi:hypothetical protein
MGIPRKKIEETTEEISEYLKTDDVSFDLD